MARKKGDGSGVIKNRSATYNFLIVDKLTVGMVLVGSEIKSIRMGRVSFADSFCFFHKGELWVKSLHISGYNNAGYAGHDPVRERKLLATKKELGKWETKIKEKGLTIIPLSIFINEKGWAKMEIGLAKGKKQFDKRQAIRERDVKRNLKNLGY